MINNLRPVEALVLMDHAGVEQMDLYDALKAALGYLGLEDYIEDNGRRFVPTQKRHCPSADLRPYEEAILDHLEKDHIWTLKQDFGCYDFKAYLSEGGFFETQQRRRGLWPITWTQTDYIPTTKFFEAMLKLSDLKDQICSALEPGESLTGDLASMVHAFPSLARNGLRIPALRQADEITSELLRDISSLYVSYPLGIDCSFSGYCMY